MALIFTSCPEATKISISPPESKRIQGKSSKVMKYNLRINSLICGSNVVIMESTELLAFSAIFDNIPPLDTAPFIQPIIPPESSVGEASLRGAFPCGTPLLGGIAALQIIQYISIST